MKRQLILTVSCDTDPDTNPTVRRIHHANEHRPLWQGIEQGIASFRQALLAKVAARLQRLPITWLLRSDRMILEVYDDAAYCFKTFEKIWQAELQSGNELGWHPHLFRWNDAGNSWDAYLDKDDDIEVLEHCLTELRRHFDVNSVRTGWTYCSNRIMHLFDRRHLKIDVSAIPHSKLAEWWHYDWSGTSPRAYFPSRDDYRVTSNEVGKNLQIVELPVLAFRLNPAWHAARFGFKNLKAIYKSDHAFLSWKNTQYRGCLITHSSATFQAAVKQQLFNGLHNTDPIFVNTFFHADELLRTESLTHFITNLNFIDAFANANQLELVATTLTPATGLAKQSIASRG